MGVSMGTVKRRAVFGRGFGGDWYGEWVTTEENSLNGALPPSQRGLALSYTKIIAGSPLYPGVNQQKKYPLLVFSGNFFQTAISMRIETRRDKQGTKA